MPKQRTIGDFPRLLGGRLCLDLANTIEDPRGEAHDFLRDYDDLVRWSRHADALDARATNELLEFARADPEGARAVFERARRLRASIDAVFRSVAHDDEAARDDLRAIQDEYLDAVGVASLVRVDGRFGWSWAGEHDLRRVLWPVAASAHELLADGDLTRVRECPGTDDCGWLFYDDSRNRTRRWCSMEGCGSRVKMRRYYARRRGGASGS